MVKQKLKINLFDLFIVCLILLAGLLVVFSLGNQHYLGEKNVLVTIEITDRQTIERIIPALSDAETVYFSGTKYPVKQVSYELKNDSNEELRALDITILGLGKIQDGNSIFNGQRIYLNQKVEIHEDYFAQGYVINYQYE